MSCLIEYVLAAMQSHGNAKSLSLRANGRRMRCEIARGGDHKVTGDFPVGERNRNRKSRFHTLDAVEVAILAQKHGAQRSLQARRIGGGAEVFGYHRGSLIDLLLLVEYRR